MAPLFSLTPINEDTGRFPASKHTRKPLVYDTRGFQQETLIYLSVSYGLPATSFAAASTTTPCATIVFSESPASSAAPSSSRASK